MQTQYNTEKVATKRVFFTGSDAPKEGYPLVYNRDSAIAKAATVSETDNFRRAYEVEKPGAGTVYDFAGLVAPGQNLAGVTGGQWLTIVVPGPNGTVCTGWIGIATTIGVTDVGLGATYVLITPTATIPCVGRALVTDASTTPKAREMVLFPKQMAPGTYVPGVTGGTTGTTTAIVGASTLVGLKNDVKILAQNLTRLGTALKVAGIIKTA
jgi:hypothetical protein